MYTLLIIDMQTKFHTALGVVDEVTALVKKAKEDFANIVVVEYIGSGDTLPQIADELVEYPLQIKIRKNMDDGGRVVFENLKERNWLGMDIIVCGVNSDCCVKHTSNTILECMYKFWNDDYFNLIGKRPTIFAVKKACNHNQHPWMDDIKDWYWDGYDSRIVLVNNEIPNVVEAVKTKNYF